MSDIKKNIEVEIGSDKSFGIVFSLILMAIGLYPLINGNSVHLWAIIISLVLIVIALSKPTLLKAANNAWFKLGLFLGGLISPIIMGLIYVLSIIPMAILIKILKKDLLSLKINRNKNDTYWVNRKRQATTMKDQF